MNQAHIHLMIVHIPIVLVPLSLILYLIGHQWKSRPIKLVALNTFVAAAAFAGLAFSFGEGAEEIVENVAGIAESAIESHEESAVVALWLTIALGLTSLAYLLSLKYAVQKARLFVVPVLLLGFLSSGALAYTAKEGGNIRHPEAFGQKGPPGHSTPIRSEDD